MDCSLRTDPHCVTGCVIAKSEPLSTCLLAATARAATLKMTPDYIIRSLAGAILRKAARWRLQSPSDAMLLLQLLLICSRDALTEEFIHFRTTQGDTLETDILI